MNSRAAKRKLLKQIQAEYDNFDYKPWAMPILKICGFFLRTFKTTVSFEEKPPTDGCVLFVINHQNFYDSLVSSYALDKDYRFISLASDEPRGKFAGLAFESKGAVYVNRSDPESRKAATETLLALARAGLTIAWLPEGTWNTSPNRLMLPLSWGMAKVAIEAAKTTKVYIVPVCMDYQYKEGSCKVIRAVVRVCKAIPVSPETTARALTEEVETVCWTTRWLQMEERMKRTPGCIIQGNDYLFPRSKIFPDYWTSFVNKLYSQYKIDWAAEQNYRVTTPEERLQKEMQRYINPVPAEKLLLTGNNAAIGFSTVQKT